MFSFDTTPLRESVIGDGGSSGGGVPSGDPTAGAGGASSSLPAAGTGAVADGSTPPVAQTPAERSFQQRDVDRIVADRLARERRQLTQAHQIEVERVRAEHAEQLRQAQERRENDGYAAPANPLEQRLQTFEKQMAEWNLDRRISEMGKAYPDFADNEDAILMTALQLKTNNLDIAYRYWKHDAASGGGQTVDETAIEARGVKKYLDAKRAGGGTGPESGKGGSSPVAASKAIKTFEDADNAAKERLKREDKT